MPALQIPYIRNFAPHILSVLRIFAAGSFFTHGTMKLFSWPAPFEFLSTRCCPRPEFSKWLAAFY